MVKVKVLCVAVSLVAWYVIMVFPLATIPVSENYITDAVMNGIIERPVSSAGQQTNLPGNFCCGAGFTTLTKVAEIDYSDVDWTGRYSRNDDMATGSVPVSVVSRNGYGMLQSGVRWQNSACNR